MTGKARFFSTVFVCAITLGIAQQLATITGTVNDPSGGSIAGAEIHVTCPAVKLEGRSVSGSDGTFRLQSIPSGKCVLTVQSPGFAPFTQIVAVTESGATVNAVLQIGAVTETVTVEASSPQINTSTSMQATPLRTPARGIRLRSGRFNTEQFKTEQYDHFVENEFLSVRRNPLSTFAADVDTASYSNARRFLTDGQMPPPESIRVEELINYFKYDYSAPRAGEPFSITTGVATCPWQPQNKIVHVGIRTRDVAVEHLPPANLVFLIDVSGSMDDDNKLPLVKRSMRLLVEQLRAQDRVGIVVYAGRAGIVLPPTAGNEKERILRALDGLAAGGSTHGSAGIRSAYQLAREAFIQGGNNRVILATDGDFNVGVSSDGELVRLIEGERESGIFLTVLGFGMGNYKDSKMEKLADHGNGSYAYVDSFREAQKVLVEQMAGTLLTVAKDVKFQVEFNPARVSAYRLIGYENRILRPEEFNDDKKDAGDAGAGMSVTALYEIVPAGSQQAADPVDKLRYQETGRLAVAAKRSPELGMLKIRFKNPNESKSNLVSHPLLDTRQSFADAPAEMRFATAVAEFGLLLRQSKFAGRASFDHAIAVADAARGKDVGEYRAEFIDLVKSARALRQQAGGIQ